MKIMADARTLIKLFMALLAVFPTFLLSAAASFTLTSPVGGESWMIGTSHDITWSSSDVSGTVCVEVLKLKTDGSTVCFAMADAIPVENSKWTWNIPYEIPLTSFYVRISLTGAKSMESTGGNFSVVGNSAPYIAIRAPVGGEIWALGTAHQISWESHNIQGNLKIIIKKTAVQVLAISDIPVVDGRYSWTLPADLVPGEDYTVTVNSPDAGMESTSGNITVSAVPPAKKKWTFMKYLDCDNNLEECELDGFVTIASVGSDSNVNVVAQVDRHPAYDTRFGNWTDAKRFYVSKGMEPTPANAIQDLGEISMASKSTLTDFLCWAMDNYPADRYFLVFSNHGLGWESDEGEYDNWKTSTTRQGGSVDSTNGQIYLSTRAIQEGIDAAPSDLNIVGFDACDMDMLEVAYQIRNTGAKVFIGSQNTEGLWGWDYIPILSALQARPNDITETELGSLVCNTFMDNVDKYIPFYTSTQAAIDLSSIDGLAVNVSALADAMRLSSKDKGKAKLAAGAVLESVRQAVICERHNKLMDGKIYGMNFYFPDKRVDPKYNAENLDFVSGTTWKTFLDAYFAQDLKSTWIGKARKGLWEEYESDDPTTDFGHIDIVGFCLRLNAEPYNSRIFVSSSPSDISETTPSGTAIVKPGKTLELEAKLKSVPEASNYHFARWATVGGGTLKNPFSAKTSLTVNHDGSATAIFAENKDSYAVSFSISGHGSLTGESSQTVPSGGSCSTVTAVPESGYVFLFWTGDYSGTDNPLTVTNVLSDMKITAAFGNPASMSVHSLSISLDNKKSSDKISIKSAVYPVTAPTAVQSAKLAIDGTLVFDCPSGSNWTSKNGVLTYSTSKGDTPKFMLVLDTANGIWSFKASDLSAASQINPLDGISIELSINGNSVGKTAVPLENLQLKSKIEYSGK